MTRVAFHIGRLAVFGALLMTAVFVSVTVGSGGVEVAPTLAIAQQ